MVQVLIGQVHQRGDSAAAPIESLRREPVFETRRIGHTESLEELAAYEFGRRLPVPFLLEPLELVDVELHRIVRQPDQIASGGDVFVSHNTSYDPNGFTQRMSRGGFRFLGPQEAGQMLARAQAFGGPGKVDEQREVLAPENLGGRIGTVDLHLNRSERAARDHREQLPGLDSSQNTVYGRREPAQGPAARQTVTQIVTPRADGD